MGKSSNGSGLLFSFAEMRREIENMSGMARKFLDAATTEWIIPKWLQELRNFASSPAESTLSWQIPLAKPVRTIWSDGEYEPDDQGEHTVFGTLSALWEIRIPKATGRTKKKHTESTHFELYGCASTKVIVWEYSTKGEHRELARWRFEVGDSDSPGCHFHVQIMGEKPDKVFPKTMSVPRLPGLLVTPMDSLEFLLAEIFQGRWKQHASQQTDPLRHWSSCQRKRLVNLLTWQKDEIAKAAGSPWTSLKGRKPNQDLLLADLKL
jgi:hypothetical protein